MRVAWVVDGRLDQLSGGYLYDRLIVEHLRRSGTEVTVIAAHRSLRRASVARVAAGRGRARGGCLAGYPGRG